MALSASRTETSGGLREFLNSSRGRTVSFSLVAILLLAAIVLAWWAISPSDAVESSRDRWFVDSTTMKPFRHELKEGESMPIKAPSGSNTGYPAELCYWTKDGQTKDDPTPVLLNDRIGKSGPTFCPDCGRLVVGHNPLPMPGKKPPPTEAEYKARGSGGGNLPSRDGR
jgi:hypothetical protein